MSHRAPTYPLLRAAFLLLFLCAASAGDSSARPATAQDAPAAAPLRTVSDDTGRSIRVAVPVRRVVSLSPSMTEIVYALGLEDQLVGDTDYCDYPPEAQKKPKVGGAINPNLEQIAALRPDLVLVTKDLNRLDTVRALDTLGIPSYSTDAAHTIDGIISSTERLADILGAAQAGKVVGDGLHHRLATLQEKLRSAPATHVLFVVWTEPLISAGKNTFIADALRKAGAVSIVD